MGDKVPTAPPDERFCVRVRNLPAVLSVEAVTALLSHYGATRVRLLRRRTDASSGREPGTLPKKKTQKAMAMFTSREAQQSAQRRLHALELAGHRLQVEVVGDDAKSAEQDAASLTDQPPLPKGQPPPLPPPPSTVAAPAMPPAAPMQSSVYAPVPLAPHLGLHYAPSPLLEYKYPKATESIVRNIANALIALPKFYTQVLHLMNKMNLPPPFEEDAIPGRFSMRHETGNKFAVEQRRQQWKRGGVYTTREPQIVEEEEDDDDIAGEEKENLTAEPDKRAALKRPRPHEHAEQTASTTTTGDHREASGNEAPPELIGKPLLKQHKRAPVVKSSELTTAFGLTAAGDCGAQRHRVARPGVISEAEVLRQRLSREDMVHEPLMASYECGTPSQTICVWNIADSVDKKDLRSVFGFVLPLDVSLESMAILLEQSKRSALVTYPDVAQALAAVEELHGVVLENKPLLVSFQKDSTAANTASCETFEHPGGYWTTKELASRRLPASQLATEKAMEMYERGEPSTTLYVKNLAKAVKLEDLHAVFGAVLAPDAGPESLAIRHFTEGRMRCQAFVEYPTIALACDALEQTHSVVLKDKPLVVCFRKPPADRN